MLPGLEALVQQCAPQVAPQTMLAIVQTESRGNPWAINVNGARRLARQPASRAEATAWAQWLVEHGYSVDIGLAQVNSRHMARFGISPAQLLDPCTNLAAGAAILSEFFGSARLRFGATPAALHAALSAYNTGNFQRGLSNGYVGQVYKAAAKSLAATPRVAAREPEFLVYGEGSGIANTSWVAVDRR